MVCVNLYTEFKDYISDRGSLRSLTAYKELFQTLSTTSLNELYDFSAQAIEYEIAINNAKLSLETENIKLFLAAKGEFGEKLYEHIYAPAIKEKYDILNKIAQGSLNQEQADALKTNHLIIELENRIYNHCIEIKTIITPDDKKDFICYSEDLQVIDHLIIGENNTLESVENLYE